VGRKRRRPGVGATRVVYVVQPPDIRPRPLEILNVTLTVLSLVLGTTAIARDYYGWEHSSTPRIVAVTEIAGHATVIEVPA